jgi:hypothetical protein
MPFIEYLSKNQPKRKARAGTDGPEFTALHITRSLECDQVARTTENAATYAASDTRKRQQLDDKARAPYAVGTLFQLTRKAAQSEPAKPETLTRLSGDFASAYMPAGEAVSTLERAVPEQPDSALDVVQCSGSASASSAHHLPVLLSNAQQVLDALRWRSR